MDSEETQLRLLFGRFLEKAGLVTADQVREAMRFKTDVCPSLAETAIVEEKLTAEQLREIRQHQRDNAVLFEAAAQALGHLDEEGLTELKQVTKSRSVPIGRALVLKGALTEDQLEEQIEAFHDYNAALAAKKLSKRGAA